MYPVIVNEIRAFYPRRLNKGFGSKFYVGSRVRHETPEEGRRTHWPKRCDDEENTPNILSHPLGCGCRIHRLHPCRGGNESPSYDTKQSEGEALVMLELWGMWSTPSLPSFPGLLWTGVGASDRVLSMGQIELNCVLMLN